ncbi:MAG: hypothetical protein IJ043_07055 [Clostridia bacterium]|nr:hypothetical protein [Clostridia bacterium]
MPNTEIFKTVFKGYSKEEVIAYIDNLNQQMSMLQKELDEANARLIQLEDERKETCEQREHEALDEEALRQKIAEEITPILAEKIREKVEADLRPKIEAELRQKIEKEMAAKYEEAARSEINQRLHGQLGELQELRRRAQLYDSNREVLAELMIKAKNDAAEIVKDAETHAKELRMDAEQRYKLLISDYELLRSNLLIAKNEASEKLNNALRSLNDFEKRFSCSDQDVARSKEHLEEQS